MNYDGIFRLETKASRFYSTFSCHLECATKAKTSAKRCRNNNLSGYCKKKLLPSVQNPMFKSAQNQHFAKSNFTEMVGNWQQLLKNGDVEDFHRNPLVRLCPKAGKKRPNSLIS